MKISNNIYETYPRPITLRKALSKISNNGDEFADVFMKDVSSDANLASQNVKSYLNRGSAAIVFETSDGQILKLTEGNHFPLIDLTKVLMFRFTKKDTLEIYIIILKKNCISMDFQMFLLKKSKEISEKKAIAHLISAILQYTRLGYPKMANCIF